jgi:gentisate 1,2-dioxygenase
MTRTATILRTPDREAFYQRLGAHSMAPLGQSLHQLVTRQPTTPCVPARVPSM